MNELIETRQEFKAKTVDNRLTELNFYRSAKLFEPNTKTVEKQTENINENLDVLKKQITLPSSQSQQQIILPPPNIYKIYKRSFNIFNS